jgi:hypothetical protein
MWWPLDNCRLATPPHASARHRPLTSNCRLDDGGVRSLAGERSLPVRLKFGYVWTTLGHPDHEVFDIPEYAEPDRRNMNAASFGLHVSAPRAVENFLDLGHFAFVHTNYLGVEPHTEIKPYKVEVSAEGGEILATKCMAYQPQASLVATEGHDVEYVYRVPHPYCAILYKSNGIDPARQDVIAMFLQPASEERVVAHMLLSVLDAVSSDKAIKRLSAADLQPGQADPGKPDAQAPAAEYAQRIVGQGRCQLIRLSALAERQRRALRHASRLTKDLSMDSDKGWFPVARVEEVVPRHVVHAQLLGQEIALWRDDAGQSTPGKIAARIAACGSRSVSMTARSCAAAITAGIMPAAPGNALSSRPIPTRSRPMSSRPSPMAWPSFMASSGSIWAGTPTSRRCRRWA